MKRYALGLLALISALQAISTSAKTATELSIITNGAVTAISSDTQTASDTDTTASNIQVFHVEKHRWGRVSLTKTGKDIAWGRNTKSDFDIILDLSGNKVVVNGPNEPATYTINDEHPYVIERYTPMHQGKSYCMVDEDNVSYEIYLRESKGKVTQILICDTQGTAWSYQISQKQEAKIDTDYGEVSAEANPYASKSVKQSKGKRPIRDIYDLLSRVPGVQVLPGGKVAIRGVSSVNSGTEPLILVDGNTVNSLDSINPQDVESVNVIKDADASIYGFRGSNGVISIKLK